MSTEHEQGRRRGRRRRHRTGHADGHRQPHGPDATRSRSRTARSARMDLRQIKVDDDDFGLMTYDPAFMNTASCRSAITYIDGDKGILEYRGYPIEQLAEQLDLPRGRLPARPRRAADAARSSTSGCTRSRSTRSCTRTSRTSWRASATTRTRWGCCSASVGALSTFYPDAQRASTTPRAATIQIDPADREDADARRVRLPPQHGPAVRLSRQRPALPGQLPRDALQDDRAQVPARPAAGARARRPLHPARRPRAELLDERGARGRLLAGRSVLGGRGRRRGALRPAARRRQRGGAADAAPDRDAGEHPRLHRGREGRRASA